MICAIIATLACIASYLFGHWRGWTEATNEMKSQFEQALKDIEEKVKKLKAASVK